MPRPTTPALLATVLLALGRASAPAMDQPIPGKKLVVKVVKGRETLKFVARGTFIIPAPASTDNPIVSGATVLLTNPSSGESFTFDLPAAHWTLNARKTTYRYRDPALVEPGRVTAALIKTRLIKVAARRTGITLDESAQGALAVQARRGDVELLDEPDDVPPDNVDGARSGPAGVLILTTVVALQAVGAPVWGGVQGHEHLALELTNKARLMDAAFAFGVCPVSVKLVWS